VGIVPPKDVLVLHPVALTGKFTAIGVGEEHSCALHEDGSVWCWGDNLHGNLGDGTKKASPQPVQVLGSAQK
jgi:alpha-tubulin suppressor-like RCC1 family protein